MLTSKSHLRAYRVTASMQAIGMHKSPSVLGCTPIDRVMTVTLDERNDGARRLWCRGLVDDA